MDRTIALETMYSKEKSLIEKIREDVIKRRIALQQLTDEFIYKLFRDDSDGVSFDDMKEIEIGERKDFPTKDNKGIISSVRQPTLRHDELKFETTFSYNKSTKEGAVLIRHAHPDCDETIIVPEHNNPFHYIFTVIVGSDKDGNKETIVLYSGEALLIPKGIEHQVSNASKREANLTVKFIKKC